MSEFTARRHIGVGFIVINSRRHMTPDQLNFIAGIVLSFSFSYLPGLRRWFEGLQPDWKRLVMLAVLFGVTAILLGLSCVKLFTLSPQWGRFPIGGHSSGG
jgi:hypothetical protein